jgi:hypothetical protein
VATNLFGGSPVPDPRPGTSYTNPYSAGNKHYGAGRPMPNIGPTQSPGGYNERDNRAQARKNAILRRMQGAQTGNPMDQRVMGYISGGVLN